MKAPEDVVLCINSGSSSLKFAVFAVGKESPRPLVSGSVDRIGSDQGRAWVQAPGGERKEKDGGYGDHSAALEAAFSLLDEVRTPAATIVGHRVVHGGPRHVEPERIDALLVESLKALIPIAPLHMPAAIKGIEIVAARRPDIPQVACFDTAFHASMPEVAHRLPIPDGFDREGIRRYGFHGLSYEYVMSELGAGAPSRVVIAHLGNGSSLVAVKDGRAVDTTMGLTPAGGVLMGTRTGDLDPGVLIYLLREKNLSVDALERLVNRESGLLALGGTSDMKTLLERAATDERAALAVSMFAYDVRKAIGGLMAVLGGADLIVFTGGVGEHSAKVRGDACQGLVPFGVVLDQTRNDRGQGLISSDASACAVRVIATNEDLVIARHAVRVLRGAPFAVGPQAKSSD